MLFCSCMVCKELFAILLYWSGAHHTTVLQATNELYNFFFQIWLLLSCSISQYPVLSSLFCLSVCLCPPNQLIGHGLYEWNNIQTQSIENADKLYYCWEKLFVKMKDKQGQHANTLKLMWQHQDDTIAYVFEMTVAVCISDECFFVLNERQVTLQRGSDRINSLLLTLLSSSFPQSYISPI